MQHVVGDDRRPAAVLALAGGGVEPLQRRLADALADRATARLGPLAVPRYDASVVALGLTTDFAARGGHALT
ncbi:hypothetical protein [Streptomyces sp. NPDC051211]|uniref:hypothetical protein n=1 Tax=Streptomyces sp. NPDC051211 TaxID=3154643 RepID=UPI00344F5A2E